jgi:hypothetical protein
MADKLCTIPYQGHDYELHPRDITVGKLRMFKDKYGKEYGSYISFVNLFLQGDADAVACALHIVLAKEGKNKPPEFIEYSPFDIYEAIQKANEEPNDEDEEADGVDPTLTGDEKIPGGEQT